MLRFGPYRTPRFRYGSVVHCELQGQVVIFALSNGRIPWPKGRKVGGNAHGYRDLAKAVQSEAAVAVADWWGVSLNTVTRWRKALGVGRKTKGTLASWAEHNRHPSMVAARKKEQALAKTPEALAKLSAALRGRTLTDQHKEAVRRSRVGMKLSEEHRRKIGESFRRVGHRPQVLHPWTKAEDALLRRLPPPEAARRTKRSIDAVYWRRRKLGIPDGRLPSSGKSSRWARA